MKKQFRNLLLAGFAVLQGLVSTAQEAKPFWNEITAFQKQDSMAPPPKGAILFAGSSSFRFWTDVQKSFPEHRIINRGFGGSSLPDVIAYADEILFPYAPKQLVVYCGENDFASSDTVSVQTVVSRFTTLFQLVRQQLPKTSVVFVSIKPSPSRWHLREKMQAANREIKTYLGKQKNTAFVDVWEAMLDSEGKPKEDIFREDKLHMNAKGYAIWQKKIKPHLK